MFSFIITDFMPNNVFLTGAIIYPIVIFLLRLIIR